MTRQHRFHISLSCENCKKQRKKVVILFIWMNFRELRRWNNSDFWWMMMMIDVLLSGQHKLLLVTSWDIVIMLSEGENNPAIFSLIFEVSVFLFIIRLCSQWLNTLRLILISVWFSSKTSELFDCWWFGKSWTLRISWMLWKQLSSVTWQEGGGGAAVSSLVAAALSSHHVWEHCWWSSVMIRWQAWLHF